jgi:hypothetical protein
MQNTVESFGAHSPPVEIDCSSGEHRSPPTVHRTWDGPRRDDDTAGNPEDSQTESPEQDGGVVLDRLAFGGANTSELTSSTSSPAVITSDGSIAVQRRALPRPHQLDPFTHTALHSTAGKRGVTVFPPTS